MATTTGLERYFNKKRQIYRDNAGKVYYKVDVYVETDEGEQGPAYWKWDSLLFPNKAKLYDANVVTHADARAVGLVGKADGPKCSDCLDRGYQLWQMTNIKDTDEINIYYAYSNMFMLAEACTCGIIERNKMIDNLVYDFHRDHDTPFFRVHVRPNAYTDEVAIPFGTWPEDREIIVLKGKDGYYPEARGGSKDIKLRRDQWINKYPEPKPEAEAQEELPLEGPQLAEPVAEVAVAADRAVNAADEVAAALDRIAELNRDAGIAEDVRRYYQPIRAEARPRPDLEAADFEDDWFNVEADNLGII